MKTFHRIVQRAIDNYIGYAPKYIICDDVEYDLGIHLKSHHKD